MDPCKSEIVCVRELNGIHFYYTYHLSTQKQNMYFLN